MVLAAGPFGEPDLGGWFLGLALGFMVIFVVVVVVGAILALASRIGARTHEGVRALEAATTTTQALDELDRTNETLQRISRGAQEARTALERS